MTADQRRLAAILVADVVGYSKLVGSDEAGTLAKLQALRADVIEPQIAKHAGRLFKSGVTAARRLRWPGPPAQVLCPSLGLAHVFSESPVFPIRYGRNSHLAEARRWFHVARTRDRCNRGFEKFAFTSEAFARGGGSRGGSGGSHSVRGCVTKGGTYVTP